MPQKTVEQRLELIELRQDAFEMAIRALVNQDVDSAEEEGRDDIGNQAQSCIAYDDYHLTQAEREGDINPRRRRIIDLAIWLLSSSATDDERPI